MASSVQELLGVNRALDRLEMRTKAYRKYLQDRILGSNPEGDIEQLAIAKGEVETIESLIRRISRRLLGAEPDQAEWEPMHEYCSRNETKENDWAKQNNEYFRWALLWIQKTRTYVEYLSGLQHASGEPRVADTKSSEVEVKHDLPRYDVALSFAGEDRVHARKLAELLRDNGLSVFYDEYEQATLWGRNLYSHLSDVYQNKARYCLMFISSNYARKLWTKRERESAQARAFRESREYILPLRLDDTALPGIEDTVGYIDLRNTSYEDVLRLLMKKLKDERSAT
jgi:hypothetical protein